MGARPDLQESRTDSASRLPSEAETERFRKALLRWYKANGRRFPWRARTASSYAKIVSEVLLQRTQAPRVAVFFGEFIESFPSWRRLSEATETQLGEFLKPLGLWRRRAASLIRLAREMSRRRGRFPKRMEDLESLPGVGQYIANAILLLCHNEPRPLLDVNMARVLERNFGPRKLADIRYDPYVQALAAQAVAKGDARSLNWAILDLAAGICIAAKPRCSACPLATSCRMGSRSTKSASHLTT